MNGLLNRLIQSIPGTGRGPGREELERQGREVFRIQEEGRYLQDLEAARRVVEVRRDRLGDRHPDYAAALEDLGRLLQTRGDLGAAEPLLREAVAVRKEALGGRDPQYAASLGRLAELLRHRGDLQAAEPLLREALEVRREALGDRHPDVATSLIGLALLLRDRGDLQAAEPLLQQALEIRREALGDQHPDVAASLSHLGTLLFARENHAAAEPLLRQAVTLRKGALGSRHPDVVADLQTLEAILQARSRPVAFVAGPRGPATTRVPIPAAASDTALEQLGRGPREIAAEARGLAETFARIGAALEQAGRGMRQGFPPPFPLLNDAAVCHNAFAALHDEAVRRADAVGLAPPAGSVLPLLDLAALMDRVGDLEEERNRTTAARIQALSVLDRVLALRHVVASESSLLQPCHDVAAWLRASLADARLRDGLPADASRLADGSHPLAALVRLAESGPDPSLSDDEWSRLRAEVVNAFGRPLAAAAVRGRLISVMTEGR